MTSALRLSAALYRGLSIGLIVPVTPARPGTRGRDNARGPTPSISAPCIETVSTDLSLRPIALQIRTSPPAMPYQVTPLPSMIR